MKRLLLLALLLPLAAQAQTQYTREAMLACPFHSFVAGDIFERRQSGEPKEYLIKEMQQHENKILNTLGVYMVDAAYAVPPVTGNAYTVTKQGFKDSFYVYCLKQMSGVQ